MQSDGRGPKYKGGIKAMRKIRTRAFSILLTCAMLLSLLPVTALAGDGEDGTTVDTSWYSTTSSEFTIATAGQLAGLAQLVNGGNSFSGKTIKLGADIDLDGKEWTPIGKSGTTFQGTFDGAKADGSGNYTISNLYINKEFANTTPNNGIGLFGYTNSPAVIKNVDLVNVDIQGSLYVGAVVGYGYTGSEISNCHVSGKIAIDGWWYIGGIGGNGYMKTVSNCSVNGDEGSYIKGNDGSYVGGIWGFRGEGSQTISDCSVDNVAISGVDRTGGICGIAHYQNTIEECSISNSIITTTENAGNTGLIAGADLSSGTNIAKILDCTVTNTAATSNGESITTKIGKADNDGNPPAAQATVGSGVTFDSNGKVTGGTLEQVDDSMIADGLAKGEPAADGTFELVPTTGSTVVAKVGSTYYTTLEAAFAALNETNYSLTLLKDDAWTGSGSIYWQAGTSNGYAASLRAAVETASQANGDAITLVCKPNANDITDSSAHINVTKDITVYANGAEFGGDDLAIGTYAAPQKTPTTVNIYCAKNLVVWGNPVEAREDVWDVNFVDCENDGWNLLMYRGDESGKGKINLTLTGCEASGYSDSTIHTTADGSIKITECTFTNNVAPVNIAHKQAGEMKVVVEDSTFTGCGSTSTTNSLNQYAAPIRFANNGTGTLTAVVDTVTITGTVGDNGDILLGDGRTGKTSTVVSATITGTDATVQVQYPGDWAGGTLNENVTKTEVSASSGGTFSNAVAKIGDQEYVSLEEAINAAQRDDTIEVLADSTVSSWHQTNTALTGVTINGNDHKLTVTGFTPATLLNGLIASYGNNKINDLTIDLSGLTGSHTYHSAIVAQNGDVIDGVKVIGPENIDIYGVFANGSAAENELITIQNCEFTNCYRGVSLEPTIGTIVSPLESLVVEDCIFTDCGYIILYAEDTTFTGNTVDSRELNIMHSATSVTENKFIEGTQVQFFASPEAFEKNSFDATSYLKVDKTYDKNMVVDISENYWGGGAPSTTQVPDSIKESITGQDVYYVRPAMNDEDLNTYVPPHTGGGSSSSTTYQVTVDKAEGGKITVSPTRAEKGETVTITVKPDEGYELGKLTVTDKDGDKVTLTQKDDNKYTFKMPAGKVTVKATFTEIEVEPEQPELPFSDVAEQDWFYDAVVYVYENELMNGTSATTFSPSVTTSRAMMLTMLARYDGVDTSTGSTWYEAGAAWAVAEGVSDGTNLEADLTREQLVTMLWRYAGSPMVEKDLPDYPDRDEVSDWAVRAMVWAVDKGIITGNGAGELDPQGSASRAEVATILMRFIQL